MNADCEISLSPTDKIVLVVLRKMNVANNSVMDKKLRNDFNHRNNYSYNQKDVTTNPKEKLIINFFNWRVMLSKKGDLIIMGTSDCGNVERSKPINKRLTATIVESIFNHTYHLNGNLVDYSDELPDYIRFKFFNGFPEDWKNVTYFWKLFVTLGSNSNFYWPKLEYMQKGQIQNAIKFKEHLCTFCGKKCNNQIPINDNNVCDKTYLLSSTDLPSSSKIQKVKNTSNNDVNKENQNKYENLNDNQLPHFPKKNKTDSLKDDIPNKIVTNLLRNDVPLHEISRLLEILGFDKNILWSKVASNVANSSQIQSNKMINNFERSYNVPLLKNSIDSTKNNVEESHRTSGVVVREKQNVSIESEEINDTLLQQPNKENSKTLESNAYVDKPTIISDRILLNEEILVKQNKCEQNKKIMFCNPTARNSKKFRKSMKTDREIHHFNLDFNNIESDTERHDSINISESVNIHKSNEDYMKYCTKGSNKRENDSFSINSNSSTEESKQEKHWNKTEEKKEKIRKSYNGRRSSKISKRGKTNDASKDANFKVPLTIKINNQPKMNKTSDRVLLSAMIKKQQLPIMKRNLRSSNYKNVPWKDAILFNDDIF
ncbi:hypothetical protein M0802_004108 [Mischocyttarus mexicanus]|nr:hypothetical protein M0802_004108 [Mischocyttarus mexicanus]